MCIRDSAEGQQIRRRRECPECSERFTTFETAELLMPRVIKQKNNTREPFNEQKLREGLYRALEKRPVGEEEIELDGAHEKETQLFTLRRQDLRQWLAGSF